MNQRKIDLDLSDNQRIASLLGGTLLISVSLFNIEGWRVFLLIVGMLNLVFFLLITFKKREFARGINFFEDRLELKRGIYRKPILIKWSSIIRAEFESSQLNLTTNEGTTAFGVVLSPSQIRSIKKRLSSEFQTRNIELR